MDDTPQTPDVTVIDDDDVEVLEDTPTTMVLRVIATGQILVCKKHGAH